VDETDAEEVATTLLVMFSDMRRAQEVYAVATASLDAAGAAATPLATLVMAVVIAAATAGAEEAAVANRVMPMSILAEPRGTGRTRLDAGGRVFATSKRLAIKPGIAITSRDPHRVWLDLFGAAAMLLANSSTVVEMAVAIACASAAGAAATTSVTVIILVATKAVAAETFSIGRAKAVAQIAVVMSIIAVMSVTGGSAPASGLPGLQYAGRDEPRS
jgi:hypothetical protein